jgi:probable rRNA maturation factor
MSGASIAIDAAVEAEGWAAPEALETLARRAFEAVMDETALEGRFAVSLLFADDAAVRVLNRDWRGFDKPTNVLSFPGPDEPLPDGTEALGDIALAFETVAREADGDAKPFDHHLAHLLVHGMLHLLGHDHEDDDEAEEMEALERRVLARLAIPDPYAVEQDG